MLVLVGFDDVIRLLLREGVALNLVGGIGAFLFGILAKPVRDRLRELDRRDRIPVLVDLCDIFQNIICQRYLDHKNTFTFSIIISQ